MLEALRHEEEVEREREKARREEDGEQADYLSATHREDLHVKVEEGEDTIPPAAKTPYKVPVPVSVSDVDEFEEEEDFSYEGRKAAWADKAHQMHIAGIGSKIMRGWDHVRRTYIRDYEREEVQARLVAARQAAFDGYDSGEGSGDESENEEGDGDGEGEGEGMDVDAGGSTEPASTAMGDTQPPSAAIVPPPAPAPAPTPKVPDWRAKARLGVQKKKLSVTKGWSALTWNQKSNINERYLVLEDDGVDVQALRDRKATSDEVTGLILARAAGEGEEGKGVEAAEIASTDLLTLTPINGPGSAFQTALQTADPHASAGAGFATPDSPASEEEDTTQPFSLDEPYQPQPSHARKRKREHEDDAPHKKRKVEKYLDEEVLAAQALEEMKHKRLRGVFRPARPVHGEGFSTSRVVFVRADGEGQGVFVSARGFELVMSEVRFLANADGADGEVTLNDPDLVPESWHGLSDTEGEDDAMAGVTVTEHGLGYTVVQGETQVLAGLFKILGREKLLHRMKWEWDGLRLQPADGFVWVLSEETQGALRKVEGMLRDGVLDGVEGVEVLVGVVPA